MATSLRESYECLGLPTNASDEEVRRAYKQKALECHPDKNPDDPRATEKFQALRRSYERIVSDSNVPGGFEDDDEPSFGRFGSFFQFVIFQEMMRRKMEEAMLARMFGGIFVDDDDSDDESGLPFGFFGSPSFQRPRHFESSARSQRRRFHNDSPRYERSTYEPRARRPPSARPWAKENRNPSKPARAETRSRGNKPRTAESRHENAQKCDKKFDAESSQNKYEEEKFGNEAERQDKEKDKHNRFSKQRPKGKNPKQMTSSEWQKGRKRKHGHKKRQFPKCSSPSSSKAEENQAQKPAGFDCESETSESGHHKFPPQTQTDNTTQEEHSYCSEVNHDILD